MRLSNSWLARCSAFLVCLASPLFAAAEAVPSPDAGAAARQISGKWGDAVVTVRMLVKMRMVMEGKEMDEEERTSQLSATVIDPAGLAVCSLSEADPSHALESVMQPDFDYRFETEVVDVKIVLASGKDLPARVVLRDKDLDLAFVRPTDPPDEPLPAVDLTESASPQLLDQLVILGRLGEVANRAHSVSLDRIQAIVTKPRTAYVTGLNAWVAGLGCPAFTLDGKVVGILVLRLVPSASVTGDDDTSLPILLPAADILKAAQQASG